MQSTYKVKKVLNFGPEITLPKTLGMMESWEVYRPSLSECILAFHEKKAVQGIWNTPGSDAHYLRRVGNVIYFDETYERNGEICGILSINQHLQSACAIGCEACGVRKLRSNLKNEGLNAECISLGANFIGAMIFRSLAPLASFLNKDCDVRIGFMREGDPVNLECEELFRIVDSVHEACEMLRIDKKRILIILSTVLGATLKGIKLFEEMKNLYKKDRDTRRLTLQLSFGLKRRFVEGWRNRPQLWEKALSLVAGFTQLMQRESGSKDMSRVNVVIGPSSNTCDEDIRSLASFIKKEGLIKQIKIKITSENTLSDNEVRCKYKDKIKGIEKLIPEEVSYTVPGLVEQEGSEDLSLTVGCGTAISKRCQENEQIMKEKNVRKKTVILFTGHPSTGKTTSTQRLYFQLLNNYKVSLLSTLSIRESLGLMRNLHSSDAREKVYNEIINQTEQKIKENEEFIILDGNFNKRYRREKIYNVTHKYDVNLFIIMCTVDREEVIRKRLDYRKRNEDNIQHRASSLDLYYLIKDGSDPVHDDLLPDGKKPVIIEYNTEKKNLNLHYSACLNKNELTIIAQIYKAILPTTFEQTDTWTDICSKAKGKGIKAIIFDIGGVIQELRWDLVTKRIAKIRPDLTIDQFRNAFYYEKEQFFGLYETSKITAIEFWTMVARRIGISIDHIGEISDALTYLYSPVDAEMSDLIISLKQDYKLFILSNSCLELERAVKEYKDIYRSFDKMYFSHRIGHKKPNISSYQYLMNDNGLRGEECIFIDDVVNNVMTAEELGMKGILFVSTKELSEDLNKYVEA